jgi:uncharacterized membrane protein
MENEPITAGIKNEGKDVAVGYAQEISGPLPSSREFAGYEQTLPGSAHRILTCMEQEAANRHENEKTLIKESLRLSFRGQNFGMITILISSILITLSIIFKQPLAAIAPCILAIGSLAAIFFGKK